MGIHVDTGIIADECAGLLIMTQALNDVEITVQTHEAGSLMHFYFNANQSLGNIQLLIMICNYINVWVCRNCRWAKWTI